MDNDSATPKTLGQAIDEIVHALGPIDGPSRITAIRAACEHLKVRFSEVAATDTSSNTVDSSLTGSQAPGLKVSDIKSFRNERQPSSANEMAAVVAFFLSELAPEGERKSEVQTEDMVKYFKQAGFPLPKTPRMLLTNAKNSGYFDSGAAGGYKLNAVGYNLVAHNLPRVTGTTAVVVPRRRPRTAARKGKTKMKKRR